MKEELRIRLIDCLITAGIDAELVKNDIVAILGDYDVTRATKEIMLMADDQNMFFLKKFLMAKRVKGLTDRTLKAYHDYLKAMLLEIKKPATEISVDDLRLYFAIKETRDNCGKVSINNIQRVASTFFTFLMQEEYIKMNPAMKIGQVKVPKKKKKSIFRHRGRKAERRMQNKQRKSDSRNSSEHRLPCKRARKHTNR